MNTKRLTALLLSALALVLSLNITAFAESSSTTATIPVTLTVDNQYRAVNVTVPALLPVYVINGTVLTADNAEVTNNSKSGNVQITALSITDSAYRVGNYDNFSGSKTIALKINGCITRGSGKMSIETTAFPVINAGKSLHLTYFAKISGDAPNAKDVEAAKIIFTISIVD